MREIKSIFELTDGSIIQLSEIRYINKPMKFVDIAGGSKILFSDEGKEDLDKLIIEYKEYISIYNRLATLKVHAETIMYSGKFSKCS